MENKTTEDMFQIFNSIGTQGNYPEIRKVDGTKEETKALFNLLVKGHEDDVHTAPSNPNVKWLNLPDGHQIKYREGSSNGAEATLDFIGIKYRDHYPYKSEIKFINE